MLELLFFLSIVTTSLVIVRAGTIALNKTGLSIEAASFQAQSAFMGVGFTTSEAETVVSHAVRRRIIQILMLLGFGAVSGAIGTVVVTFAQPQADSMSPLQRLAVILGGLSLLVILWRLNPIERLLDRVISYALENMTDIRIMDYEAVLKLDKGYTIAQVQIEEGSWLADEKLTDLQLSLEGVLVLSIQRESGLTLGTPSSASVLNVGDKVLCYGLEEVLTDISSRTVGPEGDRIHELNKRRQRMRSAEERFEDKVTT